jgi:hypothetical protein
MEKNDKKKERISANALCQVKVLWRSTFTFTHKTLKENSKVCCGILTLARCKNPWSK